MVGAASRRDIDTCVPRSAGAEVAEQLAAAQRARRPCACSLELADEVEQDALSHWCYLDAVPCTLATGEVRQLPPAPSSGSGATPAAAMAQEVRPWAHCSELATCPHFGAAGDTGAVVLEHVKKHVDPGSGKAYFVNAVTGKEGWTAASVVDGAAAAPPLPKLQRGGCAVWQGAHLGAWSGCDRACGRGAQVRERVVIKCTAAAGSGGEHSVRRFKQRRPCNTAPCNCKGQPWSTDPALRAVERAREQLARKVDARFACHRQAPTIKAAQKPPQLELPAEFQPGGGGAHKAATASQQPGDLFPLVTPP